MVKLHTVGKAAKYRKDEILQRSLEKGSIVLRKARFESLRDQLRRKNGLVEIVPGYFRSVLTAKKRAEHQTIYGETAGMREKAARDLQRINQEYVQIQELFRKRKVDVPVSAEELARVEKEIELEINSENIREPGQRAIKLRSNEVHKGDYFITPRPPEALLHPLKKKK